MLTFGLRHLAMAGVACLVLAASPAQAVLISVPEPATLALLAAGLAGLGVARRRARNR